MTPSTGNVFANLLDVGPGLLYDRLTTAAGSATSNEYDFFTVGVGGSKTLSDTNLDSSCKLSPPDVFRTQAIAFVFATTMLPADWAQFVKNYYHRFFIGSSGKAFSEGPLHLFPGGVGLSGFAATNHSTTALIQSINNGSPDLNVVRRFADYPRDIGPSIAFKVAVISGAGTFSLASTVASTVVSPAYGGLDLMTYLDGLRGKAVS